MSLFARVVKEELKGLGRNVVREVTGVAHIQHLIAEYGKELVKKAIGNAITNFLSSGSTIYLNRAPTQDEIRQWNADRKWVLDNLGV